MFRFVGVTAVVASVVAVAALAGCAPAVTGGTTNGASSNVSTNSSACHASGTTIPSGTYKGEITSNLVTTMKLTVPGVGTMQNAGSGVTTMDGSIHLTSNGKTVTGLIALDGEGASEVGNTVHSKTAGDFTGEISGPASAPIVTGTMGGAWETLDAPIDGDGSASSKTIVGLHLTAVSCSAISGNAIAMFAEAAKPVAQYITISGTGTWTATRK